MCEFDQQIIWSDLSEDEENKVNQREIDRKIYNYYRQEMYQLQRIEEGNFNKGGVSLQIDFDKKTIKAVKQVSSENMFEREVRILQEFNRRNINACPGSEVSLKLLDFDSNNHIFSQKAGFVSYKHIFNRLRSKGLRDKYPLPFEFFIIKQMYFLLQKLDAMNNFYKVAHSDIKPHNIVIGFDFVPYFIDFGAAIFLEEEPDQYLTLCTLPFVHPKYLNWKQFDSKSIKDSEKLSLVLTFLFMLSTNKDESRLFLERKYSELMMKLRQFYSKELIDLMEDCVVLEDQSRLEQRVKDILDDNLVNYINNLENINEFLNELKEFEFDQKVNLYVIKEWDEFNSNILKLFPTLRYELNLSQISGGDRLYEYLERHRSQKIFVDTSRTYYLELLNLYLNFTLNCHTVIIDHLPCLKDDKYRLDDVISQDNGILFLRTDFTLLSATEKSKQVVFGQILRKLCCLELICKEEAIDLRCFAGLSEEACNLQEIRIECRDLNIALFEKWLCSQVELHSIRVHINEFKYRMEFPLLKRENQLRILKSNLFIENISDILSRNIQSLLELELTLDAGDYSSPMSVMRNVDNLINKKEEEKLTLSFNLIGRLCSIRKISLRLQLVKMAQPFSIFIHQGDIVQRKNNVNTYLSSQLYECLSNLNVKCLKLDFQDTLVNSQDIYELSRSIKSHTPQNMLQTLKLNLNLTSRPLDQETTKTIIHSLLQSRISCVKLYLNNKPLYGGQVSLLKLAGKQFSNDSIKFLTLQMTLFNINIAQLIGHLTVCEKLKLIIPSNNISLLQSLNDLIFPSQFQQVIFKSQTNDEIDESKLSLVRLRNPHILLTCQSQLYRKKIANSVRTLLSDIRKTSHLLQSAKSPNRKHRKVKILNENSKYEGLLEGRPIISEPNIKPQENHQPPEDQIKKLSEQRIDKLEDYIDVKSNRLFSLSAGSLCRIQSNGYQDSLSGLLECLKWNNRLLEVRLDFSKKSCKEEFDGGILLKSHILFRTLFESVKYNKQIEKLIVNLSGIRINSLTSLYSCLCFNESLQLIDLDLSDCDLSQESLEEIAKAVLSNEKVKTFRFNLVRNKNIHYAHPAIYLLKDMIINTELFFALDSLQDYNLIFSSALANVTFSHSLLIKVCETSVLYTQFPIFQRQTNLSQNSLRANLKSNDYINSLQRNKFPLLPSIKPPSRSTSRLLPLSSQYSTSSYLLSPKLSSNETQTNSLLAKNKPYFSKKINLKSNLSFPRMMKKIESSEIKNIDAKTMNLSNEGLCLIFQKQNQKISLLMQEQVQGLPKLEELLKGSERMEKLELIINNQLPFVNQLSSGLKMNLHLRSVNLTVTNVVDIKSLLELLDTMRERIVRIGLVLANTKLGHQNIKSILENLHQHSKVEEIMLDLSQNTIQPNTAKYFALFRNPRLTKLTLNLHNNFLGIDGVKYLADLIENMPSKLLSLSFGLDFNFLGNSAFQMIQNALAKNNQINEFNISIKGNQIKSELESLFQLFLSSHQSIKSYSLSSEQLL